MGILADAVFAWVLPMPATWKNGILRILFIFWKGNRRKIELCMSKFVDKGGENMENSEKTWFWVWDVVCFLISSWNVMGRWITFNYPSSFPAKESQLTPPLQTLPFKHCPNMTLRLNFLCAQHRNINISKKYESGLVNLIYIFTVQAKIRKKISDCQDYSQICHQILSIASPERGSKKT